MNNFLIDALSILESGQGLVVATIIRQMGSAPRGLGTRMVISDEGKIYGTIGGGRLEAEVLDAAKEVSQSGRARWVQFRLNGVNVEKTDMICGGNVDVYLDPVSGSDENFKSVVTTALDVIEKGEQGLLIERVVPEKSGKVDGKTRGSHWVFLGQTGEHQGDLEPEDLMALVKGMREQIISSGTPILLGEEEHLMEGFDLFLSPCDAQHRVVLFGGGHICLHLAKLVKLVGFKLVVADDRIEFVNQHRFPDADELWHGSFETVLQNRRISKYDYLVIVTRGHQHDQSVLYQALQTSAGYIGMIGSRRKRALIYDHLLKTGISQTSLDRVHAPIGIPIAAQTPEEISVSIVAELIDERAAIIKQKKPGAFNF